MTSKASLFDPPEGSLRGSVGRGAVATAAAQAVKIATQLASVVVLSRLLSPGDFGLVAMCAPVMAFFGMFQSLGLLQATVQRPSIAHEQVNFLFWINVAASVVIAGILLLCAPLIASFYNEPRVGPLIAAMTLPVLVSGLGAQHSALLNRRMEFGRIAVIDGLSAVAALAASIVWALIHPSYWALWGGAFAGAVVAMVLTWTSSRWRPGLPRPAPDGLALVNFGAGITGFNFANFFARNLDNILIGRYWGGVELGLYDRAYKLLLFPLGQITNPLSRVMIPALSRMADEPDRYRSAYLRVTRLTLLVTLPGVAWALGMADSLIPLALGAQWAESAPIFAALGFAGLLQPLNNPAGWLFISQGRSREFMIWGVATAAFAVTAFGIGIAWGALGIAIAYSVSEYLKTPVLWRYVGRSGPVGPGDVIRSAGPFVLGAHAAVVTIWVVKPLLPMPALAGLIVAGLVSYAVTLLVAIAFPAGRATLLEAAGLVTGMLLLRRRAAE